MVLAIPSAWQTSAAVSHVSDQTDGWLARVLASEEVSTKPNKVTLLHRPPGLSVALLALVGIGPESEYDAGVAYRAAGAAAKGVGTKRRASVGFLGFQGAPVQQRSALMGAINGFHGQDILRKDPSLFPPERLHWIGVEAEDASMAEVVARNMVAMRRLVNLPPNLLDPESFVQEAISLCQNLPIDLEVWDEARLKEEKCGALLAVASGSDKPPRLLMMRYRGTRSEPPVALVGKGVTFDSGGLSIKPTDSMLSMKMDMAGAATVLAIVKSAAELQLPTPLLGVVGLVENMISGRCMKLGDVITARNGKTIEMFNTDAEGRMVLADVLDVAVERNPSCIVDFATLTGACLVALGTDISGIMGNSSKLSEALQRVAKECGEWVWPLPMHPFFSEQIVGKVGDLKNMGDGRWGGATIAAKFLEEFVAQTPWVHFDIAGPAFLETSKAWQDLGATGCLVRTMVEWLRQRGEGVD